MNRKCREKKPQHFSGETKQYHRLLSNWSSAALGTSLFSRTSSKGSLWPSKSQLAERVHNREGAEQGRSDSDLISPQLPTGSCRILTAGFSFSSNAVDRSNLHIVAIGTLPIGARIRCSKSNILAAARDGERRKICRGPFEAAMSKEHHDTIPVSFLGSMGKVHSTPHLPPKSGPRPIFAARTQETLGTALDCYWLWHILGTSPTSLSCSSSGFERPTNG